MIEKLHDGVGHWGPTFFGPGNALRSYEKNWAQAGGQ
jgi:hypothetical protein